MTIAREGTCHLRSDAFAALQDLAGQELRFAGGRLATMLLHIAKFEIDELSKTATEFEQRQGVYRAITALSQAILTLVDGDVLDAGFVRDLARIQDVRQRLTAMALPGELIDSFDRTVEEFKQAGDLRGQVAAKTLTGERAEAIRIWQELAASWVEARK
jgi:hypothetical protein